MNTDQWSTFGLAGLMLGGVFLFIYKLFWPWFTESYWPARQAREQEQYNQLVALVDRLMTNHEQSFQAVLQGLVNLSDSVERVLATVEDDAELDTKQVQLLVEMTRDYRAILELVSKQSNTLKGLKEDYEKISERLGGLESRAVDILLTVFKEKTDG